MVTSSSRLAYSDCLALMEQAIKDKKGMRVPFTDEGAARHFRTRLHTARQIDRSDNARTYTDPEHKMHGRSIFDPIMGRLKTIRGKVYIYLENTAGANIVAEPLSEIEDGEQGSVEGDRRKVEREDRVLESQLKEEENNPPESTDAVNASPRMRRL